MTEKQLLNCVSRAVPRVEVGLAPETQERAAAIGPAVRTDGAAQAADLIVSLGVNPEQGISTKAPFRSNG
jgi:hypothetical protein